MFIRLTFPLTTAALLLSGCLTTQENPNYQHSTRYQGDNPTESYAQSAPAPQTTYETLPAQTTVQAPANTTTAVVYEQAPAPVMISTDATYTGETVTGTPGYMAMQNAQVPVQAPVPAPIYTQAAPSISQTASQATLGSGPVAIDYDYTPNLVTADTQTVASGYPTLTRSYGSGMAHTVVAGDTVYSLARQTCSSLADITSLNGIGSDYGIKLGQVIQLPASKC